MSVFEIFLAALLVLIAGMNGYTVYRDTTKSIFQFNLQMAAARAKQLPDISKLSYSELMKIVNDTIDYFTTKNLSVDALSSKSSEEISLTLDDLAADIATQVKMSVSPMVSQCITSYVSEDFYDRYIVNSVRLLLVARIEQQKRAHNRHRNNNQNKQTQQNKSNNTDKK